MNFCLGVMNRHARRLAGTAAQPPTPDHEFTMCSPHGNRGPLLGRPAGSLCCTSYALARNLETVAWCSCPCKSWEGLHSSARGLPLEFSVWRRRLHIFSLPPSLIKSGSFI